MFAGFSRIVISWWCKFSLFTWHVLTTKTRAYHPHNRVWPQRQRSCYLKCSPGRKTLSTLSVTIYGEMIRLSVVYMGQIGDSVKWCGEELFCRGVRRPWNPVYSLLYLTSCVMQSELAHTPYIKQRAIPSTVISYHHSLHIASTYVIGCSCTQNSTSSTQIYEFLVKRPNGRRLRFF